MPSNPVLELRLVLTTDDFDGALQFYRDALGLSEEMLIREASGSVALLAAGRLPSNFRSLERGIHRPDRGGAKRVRHRSRGAPGRGHRDHDTQARLCGGDNPRRAEGNAVQLGQRTAGRATRRAAHAVPAGGGRSLDRPSGVTCCRLASAARRGVGRRVLLFLALTAQRPIQLVPSPQSSDAAGVRRHHRERHAIVQNVQRFPFSEHVESLRRARWANCCCRSARTPVGWRPGGLRVDAATTGQRIADESDAGHGPHDLMPHGLAGAPGFICRPRPRSGKRSAIASCEMPLRPISRFGRGALAT
jgi:hypothetical protein